MARRHCDLTEGDGTPFGGGLFGCRQCGRRWVTGWLLGWARFTVYLAQLRGARLCRAPGPFLLHAALWPCSCSLGSLSEQSRAGVLQTRSSQPPKPYYERTPDPFAKPEDQTPKIATKVGAGWFQADLPMLPL